MSKLNINTTVDKFFSWYGDEEVLKWFQNWQTTNTMRVDGKHAQDGITPEEKYGLPHLHTLEKFKDSEIEIEINETEWDYEHSFLLEGKSYTVTAVEIFNP